MTGTCSRFDRLSASISHADHPGVVDHVERDDHRRAQLEQLEGEVQVPLQPGGVEHVQDDVGLFLPQELDHRLLFRHVPVQRVDARQVRQVQADAVVADAAVGDLHGRAGIVGDQHADAREPGEKSALADAGVADQRHLERVVRELHPTTFETMIFRATSRPMAISGALDPYEQAPGRQLFLDGDEHVRQEAERDQVVPRRAVHGDHPDHGLFPFVHVRQRGAGVGLLAALALRDRVGVGTEARVAEVSADLLDRVLRDGVLHLARLVVGLVQLHAERVDQERLEQLVLALDLERLRPARRRQEGALVGRVVDQALVPQLQQHLADAGRLDLHGPGDVPRLRPAAVAGQVQDRLQVFLGYIFPHADLPVIRYT